MRKKKNPTVITNSKGMEKTKSKKEPEREQTKAHESSKITAKLPTQKTMRTYGREIIEARTGYR